MKSAKDIVSFLESELDDTYSKCKYWKEVDSSEAKKYIIKAHTIESILEQIDPAAEEDKAEILVSDPSKQKPKKTFLEIYLNIFFAITLFTSTLSICLVISRLLAGLGIDGAIYDILLYGFGLLHFGSFLLMIYKSHLLWKTEK